MTDHDEGKLPLDPGEEGSHVHEDKNRPDSPNSSVTSDDTSQPSSSGSSTHQGEPARDIEKTEQPDAITEEQSQSKEAGPSLDVEAQRQLDDEELPPAVPKPRKERRGLFSKFCVIDEVTEPKHYSRRTKWTLTSVVAGASIAAPIGTNILICTYRT
jgi:hypothetical protein